MSNALSWLLGLIALAALCFFCVQANAPRIEAGIADRMVSATAGLAGVSAAVDGRDVTLTGTVPSQQARLDAGTAARGIPGVRRVDNQLGVEGGVAGEGGDAPEGAGVSPFMLMEDGGALVVRGVVGTEAARQAIMAQIQQAYPGREVRDEIEVESGTPTDWEPSVAALLPVVGRVSGPSLAIEPDDAGGGVIVLRGMVESDAVRAEIEEAARAAVRSPYTLRSELAVAGASADSASTAGDQLAASGSTDADVIAAEDALRQALAIGSIEFASGTATLTDASRGILDRVAAVLVRFPGVAAEVQGHTDSQGGDAANQALSQRRADAVEAYLVAQGVDADALTPRGFGEADPIDSNDTAEGRARNRRVVFALSPR